MANSSVRVVARFIAKPDKVDAFKSLAMSLVEPTRAEKGSLRYELLENSENAADFTFVEEWADAAALDAHMKAPHLTAALGKVGDLISAPPDIRRYKTLL